LRILAGQKTPPQTGRWKKREPGKEKPQMEKTECDKTWDTRLKGEKRTLVGGGGGGGGGGGRKGEKVTTQENLWGSLAHAKKRGRQREEKKKDVAPNHKLTSLHTQKSRTRGRMIKPHCRKEVTKTQCGFGNHHPSTG